MDYPFNVSKPTQASTRVLLVPARTSLSKLVSVTIIAYRPAVSSMNSGAKTKNMRGCNLSQLARKIRSRLQDSDIQTISSRVELRNLPVAEDVPGFCVETGNGRWAQSTLLGFVWGKKAWRIGQVKSNLAVSYRLRTI